MKNKYKLFGILLAVGVIVPLAASAAFQLVPCGGTGQQPCKFTDLILVAVRVINLLLAASAMVALYYIFMAAWDMVTALGNEQKVTRGKEELTNAIVGFGIVLISFALINLLIQGIFGLKDCNWWQNPTKLWSNQSCLLKISEVQTDPGAVAGAKLPPPGLL